MPKRILTTATCAWLALLVTSSAPVVSALTVNDGAAVMSPPSAPLISEQYTHAGNAVASLRLLDEPIDDVLRFDLIHNGDSARAHAAAVRAGLSTSPAPGGSATIPNTASVDASRPYRYRRHLPSFCRRSRWDYGYAGCQAALRTGLKSHFARSRRVNVSVASCAARSFTRLPASPPLP